MKMYINRRCSRFHSSSNRIMPSQRSFCSCCNHGRGSSSNFSSISCTCCHGPVPIDECAGRWMASAATEANLPTTKRNTREYQKETIGIASNNPYKKAKRLALLLAGKKVLLLGFYHPESSYQFVCIFWICRCLFAL